MKTSSKFALGAMAAAAAVTAGTVTASAGGFALREQGALGQGSSFAGAGASNALSAMFFNSAAVTSLDGMNTDSTISAILPEAKFTATGGSFYGTPYAQSTDIGVDAYVPATYVNYQFKNYDPRLYIGLAMNSAFGLKTEPDKRWAGSTVGSSTRLFSVNFNPVLGYKISDQLSIAAGPQFEYAKGVFKFATGLPTGPHTGFEGTDVAVGATAGLTWTPTPGTRIGLGYRSQMTHTLEGSFATGGKPTASAGTNAALNAGVAAKVDLRLPDIVNLSLNQVIAPGIRALATVEWSNWSRFKSLDVIAESNGVTATKGLTTAGTTIGSISGKWDDGWFFSGGLEYDVSRQLTVRAGGAYEISPIRSASERITSIPDANRIWASAGFSYALNEMLTFDLGYSHIFVEDAKIDRASVTSVLAPSTTIKANLDADIDIISLGMRMKLN